MVAMVLAGFGFVLSSTVSWASAPVLPEVAPVVPGLPSVEAIIAEVLDDSSVEQAAEIFQELAQQGPGSSPEEEDEEDEPGLSMVQALDHLHQVAAARAGEILTSIREFWETQGHPQGPIDALAQDVFQRLSEAVDEAFVVPEND